MRQFLYSIFLFLLFFLMILFPGKTFHGAYNGLMLWFETLLPTLLPFIIFSNLLIKTNSVHFLSKLLHPIFRNLFFVSPAGCYAVLIGFLCGYPMGAKVINDLILSEHISIQEGKYLLSFCNNTSPMFIIGFVVSQCFHDTSLILPTILILYLSPVLCSFYFRKKYRIPSYRCITHTNHFYKFKFNFAIMDHSIMNGFETITKIGGYVILFSILFSMLELYHLTLLLPFLEITNGIPCLIDYNIPFFIKYTVVLSAISFGGLCALAQTNSMIQDSKLSIVSYTKEKLITTMVTSLLALSYAIFILQ